MRRWPTWLVVGALAALGSVAVADALRGHETRTEVGTGTTPTAIRPSGPLIPPNEPAGSAMGGVLYFSDVDRGCRLRGLILPDRIGARTPKVRSCDFSLSLNGEAAVVGNAAWSHHGGLYAREIGEMVELGSPFGREKLRFPGRAPAFRPDDTFTYVRGDELVEWTTNCPPGSSRFTLTGDNSVARCRRVLLNISDFRSAFASGSALGVKQIVWLDDTRLAAVVRGRIGFSYREALAIFEAREPISLIPAEFGEGLRLEASPRGGYISAWYGHTLYGLRDRDGETVTFPPVRAVRALTWSPDERWTAVATPRSILVFRTNEGEARVRRLPIRAYDLAWR
jgi:hypothetical protein